MYNDYERIKKDKQIWKFCFYGFLKNLKFFEPYLLIYLLSLGNNLFRIGLLYSIREIIVYIFEVPSGVFADNYGKKRELMMCFSFYTISFALFFIGNSFGILIFAMIFFGLGEAFRSGTHKAMIYGYLETKDWYKHKTYVYGRTRSFSLLGSSISAFLSIIFVLNLPDIKWLFPLCIIPYILDFILIATYPDYLDDRKETRFSLKSFFVLGYEQLKSILKNKDLSKILLSSSIYDSIFKIIKDYIQPILEAILLAATASNIYGFTGEDRLKVYLGIVYGVFYVFSSIASRNVYRLQNFASSDKLMTRFFDGMGILSIILFIYIKQKSSLLIILIFFLLYLLKDARRPLFVDVCGDNMKKSERATVLSVDSQMRSVFTILFAPAFGFVADKFGLEILFLFIGMIMLVINRGLDLTKLKEGGKHLKSS